MAIFNNLYCTEIQQELEKLQEVMLRELGGNRQETEKLAIQW